MNINPKQDNIIKNNYWNWNGFKICWSVKGEDNEMPIIFLHGFGANRKHWRKNLEYFAKRDCASYSLDLIEFGDSDQPGIRQIGRLNNEIWCNQVKDFITQVIRPKNSGKVILIGNSLGSLVALTCAVSLEDQIATVIASPLPDQIQENKNSITPSRAFFTILEFVLIVGGSPLGPGLKSFTCSAQEAIGFGGPPTTSTRHILQFPAIESLS